MNESGFSKWLCGHLKDSGLFAQRLEVTTGAGVPDIAVLSVRGTLWCELKWQTKHIRPEQYVWGYKAANAGVTVNYIVGYPNKVELYTIKDAVKMTKSFKLTDLLLTAPRTKAEVSQLLTNLK